MVVALCGQVDEVKGPVDFHQKAVVDGRWTGWLADGEKARTGTTNRGMRSDAHCQRLDGRARIQESMSEYRTANQQGEKAWNCKAGNLLLRQAQGHPRLRCLACIKAQSLGQLSLGT